MHLIDRARAWFALAMPANPPQKVRHGAAPQRITAAQQWGRLTGVLKSAMDCADAASRRQSAALQQLDLAQYALYTLGDELAAVMAMPGRRERASVHILEIPGLSARSTALAA